MKSRLILGGMFLLCLALALNLVFSWSALDQFYHDSSLARISLAGRELQSRLGAYLPPEPEVKDETSAFAESLRSPREVSPPGGHGRDEHEIRTLLHRSLALLEAQGAGMPGADPDKPRAGELTRISISIARTDGRLIYTTRGRDGDDQCCVARRTLSWLRGKKPGAEPASRIEDGQVLVSLPVADSAGRPLAHVLLAFPESFVSRHIDSAQRRNLWTAFAILLVGSLIMASLLGRAAEGVLDLRSAQKKRISLIIFLVTASSQLACSGLQILVFTEFAWRNLQFETEMTSELLRDGLALGSEGNGFHHAYRLIDETMERSPQFTQIRLQDPGGRLIHLASREAIEPAEDGWVGELRNIGRTLVNLDIFHQSTREVWKDGQFKGCVSVIAKPPCMYNRLLKVIADAFTVTVISLLFLVELMVLFFELLIKKASVTNGKAPSRPEIMRPAAFLFVFGIDISVSFLPLHMKNLYEPMLGFSRDFVLGLPISVEFIFVGLSILLAGAWVDRRGWHEPFLAGLSLAGGGVLYSWLAPDCLHFIISRAVAGAGYGLSLMASQGFVIHYSDRKCKAHGLAQLFAGIYAGSICGSATGAMLAERFGYVTVFAVGAFIILTTLGYTMAFMRGYMRAPLQAPAPPRVDERRPRNSLLAFLSDRTVISLIFFSSLPAAIGVVGFLNYFSPIYLSSIGASQSTIGRILMIYGISLVYIGPCISRYVDASPDKRLYVFTGCLLGSMTFLVFTIFEGIVAAILGVLLLGLSSSFVLASQSAYVLQLPVTRHLGEGKAIGIFRSSSRIGQALGPMVFGAVMAGGNIQHGIAFFGLMYLMTAFLFLLMNQRAARTAVLGEIGGV